MKEPGVEVREQGSTIRFNISVPIDIRQEGDMFYASCRPFDVHSQGNTEDRVKVNIVEALQLFIESCFERGVLDQVLKECGFIPSPKAHDMRQNMSPSKQMIDVPLDLLVANHVQQAHAY
jgi:predicted RNase H-like HicB family nuclease